MGFIFKYSRGVFIMRTSKPIDGGFLSADEGVRTTKDVVEERRVGTRHT